MKNLIVCPVYNEKKYINKLIDQIRSKCDYPILIINDGSTDGTLELIKHKEPDYLINRVENLGYGRSLIDGFNFAVQNNFDCLVTIDGDLQHDAALIPMLFEKIEKYDIVLGSRYLYTRNHPEIIPPKSHYVYHKLIGEIINETFGSALTDVFCGYRSYKVNKLKELDLSLDGYGITIQITVQILKKKLKYIEIPVPMIYHNPVRNRIPSKEKTTYYLEIVENELQLNEGCKSEGYIFS